MTKFLLLDEEFPTNLICGFMGMPSTGKTLYAFEQAYALQQEKKGKTLWISTEEPPTSDKEPYTLLMKSWMPIFEEKYKTKLDLIFKYLPNAEELLNYIGVIGEIEIGEKNEFKTKNLNTIGSPLAKLLEKEEIIFIVVDSITTGFDSLMTGGRQNMPLRAAVEEIFFNIFMQVVNKSARHPHLVTINHISYNPTKPYATREETVIKGGKMVGHYTKVLYHFEHRNRPHGYRVLYSVRYPNLPEFGKSYQLLITPSGWKRTTDDEIESIKKAMKEGTSYTT